MRPLLILLAILAPIQPLWAEDNAGTETPVTGFEKPYAGEREALGYDPEGIEYKQNRLEDFQVVFVTSAPFAAVVCYGSAALASKISRGTFKVDGNYSKGFLIGTVVGAATIATISVMGPKYEPAPNACLPPPARVTGHDGWGMEFARVVF